MSNAKFQMLDIESTGQRDTDQSTESAAHELTHTQMKTRGQTKHPEGEREQSLYAMLWSTGYPNLKKKKNQNKH